MSADVPSSTGANRGNGESNLCSLGFLLFKSERNGDADFKFLARDTVLAAPESDEGGPPYVDNPHSFRDKPELREYKAVFVVADKEVSQFSDEITVNCAPLVAVPSANRGSLDLPACAVSIESGYAVGVARRYIELAETQLSQAESALHSQALEVYRRIADRDRADYELHVAEVERRFTEDY